MQHEKTLGSLFAGIGGFDLGFERAGWKTTWQVEINPTCRAVLADRFPHARRYDDVRKVGSENLQKVACVTAGFPCQDISISGSRRKDASKRGLEGDRSGLFYEVIRILKEIQPTWVVLENVPALLHTNDSRDLQAVVSSLADGGYMGFWRVLNAQHFGVPQRRRRIFLVGGLGRYPSFELLANSEPVEAVPSSFGKVLQPRPADAWPGHTLQAANSASRISLGGELLIAESNGWRQMAHRAGTVKNHGLCRGLDEASLAEARAAGNAVCPQVAEWIAKSLY